MSRQSIRDEMRERKFVEVRFGKALCPGTYLAEAYHHDLPFPVSIIWYRFTQNNTAIDLCNIHTDDWYRRCGLMTLVLEKLIDAYPMVRKVVTDLGTVKGAAFMLSLGFRKLRDGSGWELKVRNGKVAPCP